jgi:hypothetical protein
MRKQLEKLKTLFKNITTSKEETNLLIDTNFENETNENLISSFVTHTEASIQGLEDLQKLLLARCSSVILFFGEEDGASVQHMYTQLAEFISGYAQSKKKFEENLRKESRLKAAAAKKAASVAAKK